MVALVGVGVFVVYSGLAESGGVGFTVFTWRLAWFKLGLYGGFRLVLALGLGFGLAESGVVGGELLGG